ncbi:hypothetical protein AA14337_3343 [Acetobacter malorum DSM 14337]|uniref:Uncharacterized protein n=1 Tax=Acetobacter malorum DSM 14337 TaxID=1307910 RepID=A0ABQ0Q109_9PROT|nr:hypothetical protein [Acetobacter malorum]KXV06490.1 hypothetical protein AD930_07760 [Acetobacter malorum]GBQ86522.1 hypothetical protein AA14337_3343 [Acetobacter malorum DSM 14337]
MPTFAQYELSMPHNILIAAFDGLSDADFLKLVGLPEDTKIKSRSRSSWSQGRFLAKFDNFDQYVGANLAAGSKIEEGSSAVACMMSAGTNTATGGTRLSYISPSRRVDTPLGSISEAELASPKKLYAAQNVRIALCTHYEDILADTASPVTWIDEAKICQDLPAAEAHSLSTLLNRIRAETYEPKPGQTHYPHGEVSLGELMPIIEAAGPALLEQSMLHSHCDAQREEPQPETSTPSP